MKSNWFPVMLGIIVLITIIIKSISCRELRKEGDKEITAYIEKEKTDTVWRGANKYQVPYETKEGKLTWYGYQLIVNTAYYLGPKGMVAHTTNGMNCQNCHIDGGTLPYGNNFGKVYATYPLFRARNNAVQSIYTVVNTLHSRLNNNGTSFSNSG